MKSISRILAIAQKDFRLQTRYPLPFFINNFISPFKTTVMIILLYSGFFKAAEANFGFLNSSNYQPFVLLGTFCHSLFNTSFTSLKSQLHAEKYWLTLPGTFASPARFYEIVLGSLVGNTLLHFFINYVLIAFTCFVFHLNPFNLLLVLPALLLLSIFGVALSAVGSAFDLVFEGKSMYFDYSYQAILFLSCFYYPIEIIPQLFRPLIRFNPIYQCSQMLQKLFLQGYYTDLTLHLILMTVLALGFFVLSAVFLDHSVRRQGIQGY